MPAVQQTCKETVSAERQMVFPVRLRHQQVCVRLDLPVRYPTAEQTGNGPVRVNMAVQQPAVLRLLIMSMEHVAMRMAVIMPVRPA